MVKFSNILLELTYDLSKSYDIGTPTIKLGNYIYEFETEKGTIYNVKYTKDPKDPGQYERVYWPVNKDVKYPRGNTLTNEGDALRINATVMATTIDFLNRAENLTVLIIRPISSSRMAIVKKFIDINLPDKFSSEEANDDILIYPKI